MPGEAELSPGGETTYYIVGKGGEVNVSRTTRLLALLGALVLVIAACGDSGDDAGLTAEDVQAQIDAAVEAARADAPEGISQEDLEARVAAAEEAARAEAEAALAAAEEARAAAEAAAGAETSIIRFAFAPDPAWDYLVDTGNLARWEAENNMMRGSVGTQVDKTIDAITVMMDLIREMPEQPERFAATKKAIDEQYRTRRIPFRRVPGVVQIWEQQGLEGDPRPYNWEHVGKLSLEDMAGFAKRFKELVGHPMFEYLTNLRLQRAKELLVETRLPLYEIANRVGYESDMAFTKTFKKHTGTTPTRYRKQST